MPRKQQHKEQNLVKMLVYVLGVAPGEFGLVPDEEGWVPVKELLKALHEQEGWRGVREAMLRDAAARLAPGDLELAENRMRCLSRRPPRPLWGCETPAHLYLGLKPRAWPVVSRRGLEARPGAPILLAAQQEDALRLGRRRGPEPLLITVQAYQATDQGVVFAQIAEGMFFCDWLPADCLMGPRVEEHTAPRKTKPKPERKSPALPPPEQMPGSFVVTAEDVEKPYKRKGLRKEIQWKNARRKDRRRKG